MEKKDGVVKIGTCVRVSRVQTRLCTCATASSLGATRSPTLLTSFSEEKQAFHYTCCSLVVWLVSQCTFSVVALHELSGSAQTAVYFFQPCHKLCFPYRSSLFINPHAEVVVMISNSLYGVTVTLCV
jgi:hypothetical protein